MNLLFFSFFGIAEHLFYSRLRVKQEIVSQSKKQM